MKIYHPSLIQAALLMACLLALSSLTACTGGPDPSAPKIEQNPRAAEGPLLILVSLDGFRWDYMESAATPTLDRLAANGVRAQRLIPAFPSKTFPNHYTIVTGLWPEEHGIVANRMYDPDFDAEFSLSNAAAVTDARWWGGEPIWVTAEKQGLRAGTLFWPGSEAAIGGVLPTHGLAYDHDLPHEARVETLLGWLDHPEEDRPAFLTFYMDDVDSVGHRYGPEAPETRAAVEAVDRAVGLLLSGLEDRDLADRAHWIVVADHGMAPTHPDRAIVLDDYVPVETANPVDWNPILALWPDPADEESVYQRLVKAHPHLQVYRRGEAPEHLRFRQHRRIAPIVAVADEGWSIVSRASLERKPLRFDLGTHGYDPSLISMGALFVASGPQFRKGARVAAFENIHLYELMCHILDLEPAANSGDLKAVRHLLRGDSANSK